jgi:methionyl aminopeptidase
MIKRLNKDDNCWCGSQKKYIDCHFEFDNKIEKYKSLGCSVPGKELIKTEKQIERIRESCKINIAVLDKVAENIKEGMTTLEIDRIVSETTKALGGTCAPLGFQGYPRSVCVSINNIVCHGIPSRKVVLKDGDIVNVDASTNYRGYYSDSSRMFCIGNVTSDKKRLVDVTKECVEIGIKEVKPWHMMGNMSNAINRHAIKNGYSIVREIGGHGVGLEFHEEPFVSYVAKFGTGILMVPGMMFTIEPMINMGTNKVYVDEKDGWTVYTKDGKPSAQWEVTVLVTEDGCEVITY